MDTASSSMAATVDPADPAMGHVVFAAPGIDAFGLHHRLAEALQQRRHRTSLVCLDAGEHTFWRAQGWAAELLRTPTPSADASLPIEDLLAERSEVPGAWRRRTERWLRRCAPAIERWLERNPPDLIWLHGRREPAQRLLHFLARRHSVRVLWTGAGLLPHTLQCDDRGLDGDAAASQRAALDYRVVTGEPDLLRACLAHALAGAEPFALPQRLVAVPGFRERAAAAVQVLADRGPRAAWQSLNTWRRALPARPLASSTNAPAVAPPTPFVLVLLQDDDAPLRRHDGDGISAVELVERTRRAAQAVDPQLGVVAVAAPDRRGPQQGFVVAGPRTIAELTATATAIVTDNHPSAAIGLLAGTPVVHLGRALYGLPGVTWRCRREELAATLAKALHRDHPTLRQRFLTWLFGYGHVWCSPTQPDHNGVLGLVQTLEARLAAAADLAPLRYRRGPAWPLCATGRSH